MQPPTSPYTPPQTRPARHRRAWPALLATGLALWVATVAVTLLTGNSTLVPTVILLGSFLVPVTFVTWAYEHRRGENATPELLFRAFIVGGVLGILGASLLESYLLRQSPFTYIGVGLIEEGVKLAALVFVARHMTRVTMRDGMVLGATVGFGFAAFESAGYAMNAMLTERGLDLAALVQTEVMRGLLTPVGHGLWTAVLGGVLFAAVSGGHWRITVRVLLTYLGVSLLHGLWDSVHSLSALFALVLTGQPWQVQLLETGRVPEILPYQASLILAMDIAGMAVVAVLGIVWLFSLVRTAAR
ncbi:PrsW family intramembrane metalloprotease [Nocardiopsis suaedae]|uniref:PrsW family glutamic-type intramembrane protease n=1 Tax=Nocardiopsis suaedae TaxID=3018444 RepID=A0ABT4TNE6_9ACTN|nr:PrsW family glutamic-type intramembrane protease [Nocardiopsis suaedae]MDA2806223.1 PrsW family glutamic-type intramembrane protease [Nocardiopsis suaedae]